MIDFESKMSSEQRDEIEFIIKNYGFDPNLTVNELLNFVAERLEVLQPS